MTLLTNYNYATQQSLTPAFTRTKCVIRLEPGVAERKTEIKRNKPRTATNSQQIKERKRKRRKKERRNDMWDDKPKYNNNHDTRGKERNRRKENLTAKHRRRM